MNIIKITSTDKIDLFISTEKLPDEQEHRSAKIAKFIMSKNIKRPLIGVCLLIICAIIFGSIFLIMKLTSNKSIEVPKKSTNITDNFELIGNHRLITRSIWNKTPAQLNLPILIHPTELVVISHTATQTCDNIQQCSKLMYSMYAHHVINLGRSDISYNFLISNNGDIYEGRGWDFVNTIGNDTISISFMGNFMTDELNDDMIDAAKQLLEKGVKLGKLDRDYRVVCHNQTIPTLSPGVNVYKIVKTWKHFSPEKLY